MTRLETVRPRGVGRRIRPSSSPGIVLDGTQPRTERVGIRPRITRGAGWRGAGGIRASREDASSRRRDFRGFRVRRRKLPEPARHCSRHPTFRTSSNSRRAEPARRRSTSCRRGGTPGPATAALATGTTAAGRAAPTAADAGADAVPEPSGARPVPGAATSTTRAAHAGPGVRSRRRTRTRRRRRRTRPVRGPTAPSPFPTTPPPFPPAPSMPVDDEWWTAPRPPTIDRGARYRAR